MANGKVSISSEVVSNTINCLNSSLSGIQNGVATKIPGAFQVLADLGLFSNGLAKIEEQINSLVNIHQQIISYISSHVDKVFGTDTELKNKFSSGGSGSHSGEGGYLGGSPEGSQTDVHNVEDGQKIDSNTLIQFFPELSDETKLNLIKFIDINKGDTSLIDLLFDSSKSEELFVIVKEALKDSVDFSNVTFDDYIKIQKQIVEMLCSKDFSYPGLTDNSILIAKEYLASVSKANNINVSDLILDDKYSKTLEESLLNLYDGDNVNDVSPKVIDDYRNYIDKEAANNNMKSEELLTQNINIII